MPQRLMEPTVDSESRVFYFKIFSGLFRSKSNTLGNKITGEVKVIGVNVKTFKCLLTLLLSFCSYVLHASDSSSIVSYEIWKTVSSDELRQKKKKRKIPKAMLKKLKKPVAGN